MRIFIDVDKEKAVLAPGVTQELEELRFKRSILAVLEVQFSRKIDILELPLDAAGIFEIKETGKYDDDPVTGAAAWVKAGSGEETVYSFAFALINDDLDDQFEVDEDPDNDVAQLTFMGEISWRSDDRDHKTQTFVVKIDNDVNREGDTIPESPALIYVHDSFWRNGEGAPADEVGLDGDYYIDTNTLDVYYRDGGTYTNILNIRGAPGETGFNYKFNTATTGAPGDGRFRFNGAGTVLAISKTDGQSDNLENLLSIQGDSTAPKKTLVLVQKPGGAYFAFWILDLPTDEDDYFTFPIEAISSSGAIGNLDDTNVVFVRTGDTGPSGGWDLLIDEDGSSLTNFTTVAGTWASSGGEITQTADDSAPKRIYFNNMMSAPVFVIEADIFITSGPVDPVLSLGFFDGASAGGIVASLRKSTSGGGMRVTVDDENTNLRASSANNVAAFDTYQTIRIFGAGDRLAIWIDGTLVATGIARPTLYNMNFFCVVSQYSSIKIKNIKLWSPTLPI